TAHEEEGAAFSFMDSPSWLLLKNTFCFPRDSPSSDPDTVDTLLPVSVSHWGTAADDRLHGIYKNRNPQNILPSVVWNNSCLPSSDTSGHPSRPHRVPC